jgi:hypothetical protein
VPQLSYAEESLKQSLYPEEPLPIKTLYKTDFDSREHNSGTAEVVTIYLQTAATYIKLALSHYVDCLGDESTVLPLSSSTIFSFP